MPRRLPAALALALGSALAPIAALSLASCQLNGEPEGFLSEALDGDELRFESEPRGATAWVDGQQRGQTELTLPLRYYGDYRIELERAPYLPGRQYFVPAEVERNIAPPATPWIFPFDFAVETVQRSLGWEIDPVSVRLESKDLLAEEEAPDAQADIDAADAAALRRQ